VVWSGGCAQSGYGVSFFVEFCSGGYVWVGRVALSSGLLSSVTAVKLRFVGLSWVTMGFVTAVELGSVWICSD